MSLSDAFGNHPDLVEAGTAFQNYLKDHGVSANIDVLIRNDSYPMLQIKPDGSPIRLIQEALQERGNCAPNIV